MVGALEDKVENVWRVAVSISIDNHGPEHSVQGIELTHDMNTMVLHQLRLTGAGRYFFDGNNTGPSFEVLVTKGEVLPETSGFIWASLVFHAHHLVAGFFPAGIPLRKREHVVGAAPGNLPDFGNMSLMILL